MSGEDIIDASNSVIVARAARYGEQVRIFEDLGKEKERSEKRQAWMILLKSLRGTPLEVPARNAYWDALCGIPVIVDGEVVVMPDEIYSGVEEIFPYNSEAKEAIRKYISENIPLIPEAQDYEINVIWASQYKNSWRVLAETTLPTDIRYSVTHDGEAATTHVDPVTEGILKTFGS